MDFRQLSLVNVSDIASTFPSTLKLLSGLVGMASSYYYQIPMATDGKVCCLITGGAN